MMCENASWSGHFHKNPRISNDSSRRSWSHGSSGGLSSCRAPFISTIKVAAIFLSSYPFWLVRLNLYCFSHSNYVRSSKNTKSTLEKGQHDVLISHPSDIARTSRLLYWIRDGRISQDPSSKRVILHERLFAHLSVGPFWGQNRAKIPGHFVIWGPSRYST